MNQSKTVGTLLIDIVCFCSHVL